jgi:hypothetical protein
MTVQRGDHPTRDVQAAAWCVLVALLVLVAAVAGVEDLIARLP